MAKFENLWRDITPRVMGPWPSFCHFTFLTLMTRCGINFIDVRLHFPYFRDQVWYKFHWSKTTYLSYWKPTKGHNSKSYGPLAPIPVYTIHQVIVHVYTSFQLSSFHSSWEICYENFQEWQNLKTYHGTELRVMGPWPPFCNYTSLP